MTTLAKPEYHDVEQGSIEWHNLRCGIVTASEVKHLLTSKGKCADNDKAKAYIAELAAQRITNYVEPVFQTWDMERGHEDEADAKLIYFKHYGRVRNVGFATLEIAQGVTLGASPDGIVGDDGLVEVKSRKQKYQIETIATGEVPAEYVPQIQAQLLVTGREWCDFISYSGGLPMFVRRVLPDEEMQGQIIAAVCAAEERIQARVYLYNANSKTLIHTTRKVYADII